MSKTEAIKAITLNVELDVIYLGSDGNRYSFSINDGADPSYKKGSISMCSFDTGAYNPNLDWFNNITFTQIGIWITPEQLEVYLKNDESIEYTVDDISYKYSNGIQMIIRGSEEDGAIWREAIKYDKITGKNYWRYKLLDDHSNERKVSEIDD